MYGHNVSHAKNRTRRLFKPNLQKFSFHGKKWRLCVKCLRDLKRGQKAGHRLAVQTTQKTSESKKSEGQTSGSPAT